MKKLAVIYAVVIGGFVNAQTADEIDKFKKDDYDKLAVEIHNDMADFNNWFQNGGQIKKGDNDKSSVVGVLEHIFSDASSSAVYSRINPRIGKMLITSSDDVNITMNYNKWLTTLGPNKYDTSKYEFEYELREPNEMYNPAGLVQQETMYVKNKLTDKYDRIICIIYAGNNLWSIIDNVVH